jgi:hypothetical protein
MSSKVTVNLHRLEAGEIFQVHIKPWDKEEKGGGW